MASPPKHHLSFTDHLSLYLPSPIRPPLPRDLRPPTLPPTSFEEEEGPSVPPVPQPTPTRTGSSQEASDDDGDEDVEHGISPSTLHHGDFVSEKKSKSYQRRQRRNSLPVVPPLRDHHKDSGGAVKAAALSAKLKAKSPRSREGYHISLILTNSGSVARDHLASERTFLAYVRTSLALASTGVGKQNNNSFYVFRLKRCVMPLIYICAQYSTGAVVYDCGGYG